ncbi:MAG: hypothetical protein F4X92_00010 [Gammaproteobacteria bacterium]|nr:hypothetical protein [Gammaproteobacteria bacterium]
MISAHCRSGPPGATLSVMFWPDAETTARDWIGREPDGLEASCTDAQASVQDLPILSLSGRIH